MTTEETNNYKEYTLEADSELRFEIEDKNAKVHITVCGKTCKKFYTKKSSILVFSLLQDLQKCLAPNW